jgi:transketolase
VGIMRVQPGLTVIAPADPDQVQAALPAAQELDRPVYLRLGKESAGVPGLDGRFRIGRTETVGEGSDIAIVALGGMAATAVAARELLGKREISASVVVVSSMNPSPVDDLVALLSGVPLVITVESHYVNGGVGSLVAEVIAEAGLSCRLIRAGITDLPGAETGSRDFLYERHGISPERLAETVAASLAHAG